jgi:hypothetical protein
MDGTWSTNVMKQKIEDKCISENYKRTEHLKNSGMYMTIVLK